MGDPKKTIGIHRYRYVSILGHDHPWLGWLGYHDFGERPTDDQKGRPFEAPMFAWSKEIWKVGAFCQRKNQPGWCSSNESFYGIFYVMKCCYKHLMQAVQLKYCYGSLSVSRRLDGKRWPLSCGFIGNVRLNKAKSLRVCVGGYLLQLPSGYD